MEKTILVLASFPLRIDICERLAQRHGGTIFMRSNICHTYVQCKDGTRIDANEPTISTRGMKYKELWIAALPDDDDQRFQLENTVFGHTENIHYFKELDDESNCNI